MEPVGSLTKYSAGNDLFQLRLCMASSASIVDIRVSASLVVLG